MKGPSDEERVVGALKHEQERRVSLAPGDNVFLPNRGGDHSPGKVYKTPVSDYDIANKAYVDGVSGGISDVVDDTSPELGGDLDCSDNDLQNIQLAEFQDEHDNGNSGSSDTIDWNNGNNQKSTLTGNVTYSFTAPSGPCRLQLKLIQDGTGSRTVTWPGAVKWPAGTAPTLSTAASSEDIVTLWYDGTNYYGVSSLDFQ